MHTNRKGKKRGDRGRLKRRNWIKRLKRMKKQCPFKWWAGLLRRPFTVVDDPNIYICPPPEGYLIMNVME